MVATQSPGLNRAVFEIKRLSVGYGNRAAVENVSLRIMRNSITAMVGPSGAGKSSFLLSLNRLLELSPGAWQKGEIFFEGKDIAFESDLQNLRRRVGLIFQKPTVFPISIYDNVAIGLREIGVKSKNELNDRVEGVLRETALWDEVSERLKQNANCLSGGQKQRLCIARALALRPEVLLMDEPCSSLDPISTGKIEELMLSLKEKITLVMVTHNLFQAKRIADYTALFWTQNERGCLIEFGTTARVWEHSRSPLARGYFQGTMG